MKVQGTLSRYSQDLNQPLPAIGRHPLYISLAKGDTVFEFTLGPPGVRVWCALLVVIRFLWGMVP